MANQRNQTYVNAHRGDAMAALCADVAAARQETLQLLEQFTDEQLAAPVSLSSMADRTAGDLFAANALLIETLREPPLPEAGFAGEHSPRWRRIPLFLHLRAVKAGA